MDVRSCFGFLPLRHGWRGLRCLLLSLACAGPAAALTELLYDTEPNNAPHEAVPLVLPSGKDDVQVIGELSGQDQDAYRVVVDEDLAGRTFDVQLSGRGGALTQLDVLDFTELADGRGRIPAELSSRPKKLMTLRTTDGTIPGRAEGLLLAPGVYVLGVSHSGGEGAYSIEIDPHSDATVQFIEDDNGEASPEGVSTRGRKTFWTQGETWYGFEIKEGQAGQAWDLTFQTALGHPAELVLLNAAGEALLALETDGGRAVRRAGLALAPGPYRLKTGQKAAGVQMVTLEPGAAPPRDGREVEPNDKYATPVVLGETVAGRLELKDTDLLVFEVAPGDVGRIYDLELSAANRQSRVEVCLLRSAIRLSHCVRGADGMTAVRSLGLSEGRYELRISDRKDAGTDWRLDWRERGEARPGEEVEPNDDHRHAVAAHERGFGRGHFDGKDTDHWRFSVTGEPQLWRLQLQGENLGELTLKNSAGKVIADERAHGSQRIRLDNVFLLPGDYLLAAQGQDADYLMRVLPLGPPPEGMELEPNDDVADAERLRFGVEHFGTLTERGDIDRYAFTLYGHERVRITLKPPADGAIRAELGGGDEAHTISHINNPEPGEPVHWDYFLPPADYSVKLDPKQESDAEYTLVMERLSYLDTVADREPNNNRDEAAPLPAGGQIAGAVGMTRASEDWYTLPVQDVSITVELPRLEGIRVYLYNESSPDKSILELDRQQNLYRAEVVPGEQHWLRVRDRGEYAFDLSGLAAPAPAGPPLEVALKADHGMIRAFSPWAQRLSAEAIITNPGDRARRVEFAAHVTDMRWRLDFDPAPFDLAAGASRTVPLSIYVPWDMPAGTPTQLTVRAADADGAGSASVEIAADTDATPVAPFFHWPVPEALRGGFNAAALAFGAEPVPGPNMVKNMLADSASLFDGRIRVGATEGFQMRVHRGEPEKQAQPTVRLAGTGPVPVAGFLLNPAEGRFTPRGAVKDFAVALSVDGQNFETVLEGELLPIAEEQAFVLDEPVPARYARLIPKSPHFHSANASSMGLGEFKVVAKPGWRPANEAFNLADPGLGGHQVWAEPWIRGSGFSRDLLVADGDSEDPRLSGATETTAVLGFHHARRALVDGVSILPKANVSLDKQPTAVRIAASADSPVGPWEPVTRAELGTGEKRIEFEAPVWARYLRFTFAAPEGARSLWFPDRIAVYESGEASILGEWGHYTDIGPWEVQNTPRWNGLAGKPPNASRETARSIGNGEPAPGSALLDTWSSWYRVEAPAGDNHLVIRVSGRPSVEARPTLTDAAGETVPLYPLEQTAVEHQWEAYVEPGQSYWVEVVEPPRSVIFSWDTSASVGRYLPTIANALRTYAQDIKPGRDEVNLLPFGRRAPLLKNWQGNAYPLVRMLSAYPQQTSSSSAEQTLAVAAREMVGRPGKKAVLLLTDAATTTSAALWPALHEGMPQVYAMKLSSVGAFGGNPVIEIDLMQDWAKVRGGHFNYVTGFGDLTHGFQRAVSRLKRAVDFQVQADFDQVPDPSPATVAVVSGAGDADPTARGAVEVILDASGSMLKRMDGTRRIAIAKDAIRRTVEETLPEGIPLALRVYGHKEAGSCRTDLEIPLAPLDKASFLQKVEGIQAVNLAKTPIAESLAAVASDLKQAEGRKLVVLLTDGEETCEGDPAAAIQELQDAGIDVRVNIVGFAIDDDDLKRQFAEWAELGGGQYLDAGEAEGLNDAMRQALQISFAVIDAEGEEVARGLVDGDPLEVPPGRYSVRIDTATPKAFRDVALAPGDERIIEME